MNRGRTSFYVIAEEDFLDLLRRAAAGEDGDMLMLEVDANSEKEIVEGDE